MSPAVAAASAAAKAAPLESRFEIGDCLPVLAAMREKHGEFADLVYLDPPFNSARLYNHAFKGAKRTLPQKVAFADTWKWTAATQNDFREFTEKESPGEPAAEFLAAMRALLEKRDGATLAYMTYMTRRLARIRAVMKPTASVYLHCDPTASHYLKLAMDAIFGRGNFVNDVIWKRTSAHSDAKQFGRVHDSILFYAKDESRRPWNRVSTPYDPEYIAKNYTKEDKRGRYSTSDLTAAETRAGDSGKPWRGIDPTARGRHWAVPNIFTSLAEEKRAATMSTQEKLDLLDERGYIHWPQKRGGVPAFKRYLDERRGVAATDVITDIFPAMGGENLGYPTQKPVALLKRIVEASSNPGDIVLDPFCGCGTTIAACHELGRRFIGIDIARTAAQVIAHRMQAHYPGFGRLRVGDKTPTNLRGWGRLLPEDDERGEAPEWARFQYDAIAAIPKAEQIEGAIQRTARGGGDGGVDGLIHLERPKTKIRASIVIQVKRHKTPSMADVADTALAVANNGAFMGLLITLNPPTAGMVERGAEKKSRFNGDYYPHVAILTYEQVKAGEFEKALPYQYAVDTQEGSQKRLDWAKSPA